MMSSRCRDLSRLRSASRLTTLPTLSRCLVRSNAWSAPPTSCPKAQRVPVSRAASSSEPVSATGDTGARGAVSAENESKGQRKGAGDIKSKGTQSLQVTKIDTTPPRGTRDFFPDDKRLQTWLFNEFTSVSRSFGFEQIDFPVLESEELFVRKAGEEITEQLYNFEDKGGRRVSLRPELTPSLARLAIQKGKGLPLPAKWFAIGQCWRYERATRGRRREHYQWNMDIIGVPDVSAEAEVLAAICQFFQGVGLTSRDVGIKVSSRKVLQEILESVGVEASKFSSVCIMVDKMDKMPREKVVEGLVELGVGAETAEKILAALAVKEVGELEALLGKENEAVQDLKRLFGLAEAYGYGEYLVFDASVVRGLAYYTGVVFEGFDREGNLRAICGGGRYDKLLGTFGGDDQPCVGFGFGDAVIVELLSDKGLLPEIGHAVDDMVVALDAELHDAACGVAASLRKQGRSVDLVLEGGKKMKWVFKQAERCGAGRIVLVGKDEWERGMVRVKDQESREEADVKVEDL